MGFSRTSAENRSRWSKLYINSQRPLWKICRWISFGWNEKLFRKSSPSNLRICFYSNLNTRVFCVCVLFNFLASKRPRNFKGKIKRTFSSNRTRLKDLSIGRKVKIMYMYMRWKKDESFPFANFQFYEKGFNCVLYKIDSIFFHRTDFWDSKRAISERYVGIFDECVLLTSTYPKYSRWNVFYLISWCESDFYSSRNQSECFRIWICKAQFCRTNPIKIPDRK